jgi:hypothetical protein
VDGAGKVDGSCVVALPIDRWSSPEEVNSFAGHGGVSFFLPFTSAFQFIGRQRKVFVAHLLYVYSSFRG